MGINYTQSKKLYHPVYCILNGDIPWTIQIQSDTAFRMQFLGYWGRFLALVGRVQVLLVTAFEDHCRLLDRAAGSHREKSLSN